MICWNQGKMEGCIHFFHAELLSFVLEEVVESRTSTEKTIRFDQTVFNLQRTTH